ncbi:alpha/beta hydrolase family protein [Streptomyces sp. URMC 123]|uniref:alpha/beta hydrolase family protein n=1 Tax=Streptomyces sp. URMC 123 TaxID=3423403 RepID=UPI003F1DB568
MASFLDLPGVLDEFVTLNRSRVSGAGLDLFEYDRVTARLDSLYDWPEALLAAGRAHLAAAEEHEARGHGLSAGDAYRRAARWFHCATLVPHPDRALLARAAGDADDAMRRALSHLDPHAVRLEGALFAGWLRHPKGGGEDRRGARVQDRPDVAVGGRPGVVVMVPGLNSSKEEFDGVTEALLRRGVAVFAMDGPGQGVLAPRSAPRADYQRVVTEVIDALGARADVDATSVALIGLSLGGFYATVAAAHEPRVTAAAVISGPYRLEWDELPLYVTDVLGLRSDSTAAARAFADAVDLRAVADRVTCPLLVVDGGQDVTPGVHTGEPLARAARDAQYLLVPHGDHLLGNARADWLPYTADWLADRLASRRPGGPAAPGGTAARRDDRPTAR